MERSEIVFDAALRLRAVACAGGDRVLRADALIARLCQELQLEVTPAAPDGTMLGGAYARLQLDDADAPEDGGLVWVRNNLALERRAFAVAHELGHFVLHRGERVALHRQCDETQVDESADAAGLRVQDHQVEEYSKHARRELEANAFAAELLAPRAIVRRLFASERGTDTAELAARLGITDTLARRRLLDAVLAPFAVPAPSTPTQPPNAAGGDEAGAPLALLDALDPFQRDAARAAGPALVVAGPGTGKTATLVGRAAYLLAERSYQPEQVLALTFSNRAAGEMRERLTQAGLPGERMPVMTLHAFAATLLREYAPRVPHGQDEPPLRADFRILDAADSFLLMEDLLAELPLHYYRSLGNPTRHLRTLLSDFSQARDALLTPEQYLALVEGMPELSPDHSSAPMAGQRGRHANGAKVANGSGQERAAPAGYTREEIARARERALAYGIWVRTLRRRGMLDFGGLIQRAVELLRENTAVRADVRGRYAEILVDEFQDTNRAAGELLMLLANDDGAGLWVVGDRNQSVYRWRGASPSTLTRLTARYPALRVYTLRRCYRSVPEIVRLGSDVAASMAALAWRAADDASRGDAKPGDADLSRASAALERALAPVALEAVRGDGLAAPVLVGEGFSCDAHERAGLAEAIRRRRRAGVAFREQAVLCRTRKQVGQVAGALEAEGIPVGQLGGFFERTEVKDALALLALAAGPDARGVLRSDALAAGPGEGTLKPRELALAVRILARARRPLPAALAELDALPGSESLSVSVRQALKELGRNAQSVRYSPQVNAALASYLLRPRGYAWRLLRIATGEDTQAGMTAGDARIALAALGELIRLVARFDLRWSTDEDFQRSLKRSVRHRSAAVRPPVARADAVEGAPGGDFVSESATTEALEPSEGDDATAPAVRCFLHYLSALRSAEAELALPAGDEDALNVLTLHASKGLEFAVVYLPGLAAGQFPPRANHREDACPHGFRESDAPGEREAEERCLFYVGLTRARDSVVFTRAARYGRTACGPSPLLALFDGAADYEAAVPLFTDAELAALPGAVREDDPEANELPDTNSLLAPREPARRQKRIYALHELEQYIQCPRQYKYAREYNLLDPAEDAVHRFHRYLYRARRELHEVRVAAPAVEWEAAEARLRELWETDGPAGHAYDDFYWRHASRLLRDEWTALRSGASAAGLPGMVPAAELEAELRSCVVRVTADRIPSRTADGEVPTAETLARFHTGRPAQSHEADLTLPLYALAHQQRHPGEHVRIELVYPLGSLDETEQPDGDQPSAPAVVDVTAEARKVADEYAKPERRRRSKLDKLDEAAAGIEARLFPPKPDAERCAACAYCYVCPADPEALAGDTPAAPVAMPTVTHP